MLGQLRKLFNSVGIVFKGSGFYRTDSRSAGSTVNAQSSDSKSESAVEVQLEVESDSKAERLQVGEQRKEQERLVEQVGADGHGELISSLHA